MFENFSIVASMIADKRIRDQGLLHRFDAFGRPLAHERIERPSRRSRFPRRAAGK
jgi:hypothetical protein